MLCCSMLLFGDMNCVATVRSCVFRCVALPRTFLFVGGIVMKKTASMAAILLAFLPACIFVGCKDTHADVTTAVSVQQEIHVDATTEEAQPAETTTLPCGNSSADEEMVWITQAGTKYHCKADCSNMMNPRQVAKTCAMSAGYTPCKICYEE